MFGLCCALYSQFISLEGGWTEGEEEIERFREVKVRVESRTERVYYVGNIRNIF